jgi:TRAP-type uncharacterized transport system substrate-binding protein
MQSGARMSFVFRLVAVVFVGLGLTAGLVYAFKSFHIDYRIAYSTGGRGGAGLLQAIAQANKDEKTWLRFERVPLPTLEEAASALETGKADVALIRPDAAQPAKAATIAVLRREAVFLITPPKSSIDSFKGLKGKNLALLSKLPADEALLDNVLDHYSVPRDQVRRIRMPASDLPDAVKQKKVDAVFMIASPESQFAAQLFSAIAKTTKAAPDIVGVGDAEGIAKRLRKIGTTEIAQGQFPGASPRPDEAITTLAVTYNLMASTNLSNMAASEIARLLSVAKTRLAATGDNRNTIETPDTDDASLNLHPGAKAYYDGEPPSIWDNLESVFWIGSALLSVIASGFAWLLGRLTGSVDNYAGLDRLVEFLNEVHEADEARLSDLKGVLDQFVENMLRQRSEGKIEPEDFNSLSIAVNYARQAMSDRRELLAASGSRATVEAS